MMLGIAFKYNFRPNLLTITQQLHQDLFFLIYLHIYLIYNYI